jgi:hypothetical protein
VIILCACLLLLAVHALLPGSDLRAVARMEFRHTWLIWGALGTQVLLMSVLPSPGPGVSAAAHLGSYVLAGSFAMLNRAHGGGIWLVSTGGGLNLAAIAANGGVMPASAAALAASGWQPAADRFANSAALPRPRLAALGDVFATPGWVPVDSVFSVGDVVIVAGVALLLHATCRRSERRAVLECET